MKRKKVDSKLWVKNKRKTARLHGKPYVSTSGNLTTAKSPKELSCKCPFMCKEFTSNDRKVLCEKYYQLDSYERQRDFICQSAIKVKVQQRKTYKAKRTASFEYYLAKEDKKVRVCRSFFMATYSMSAKLLKLAVSRKNEQGVYDGVDRRGRKASANKVPEEKLQLIRSHIASYPQMESHYCRKSSQKKYLSTGLTLQKMYSGYHQMCLGKGETALKPHKYREIFNSEFNLSFYKPKKDQCSVCTKYNNLTTEEKVDFQEIYSTHIRNKELAQMEKRMDKQKSATDPHFQSVTFDLQSVLYTPCSAVSTLFYKRKLSVYNFTVYEQAKEKNGFCYLWPETDGNRGATEISSCLLKYLSNLPDDIRHVSMFSDSCFGQNRNVYVAAMMLHAVSSLKLVEIDHKFLETGHTYMECDSMHSAIEFVKKNRPIYIPCQWGDVISMARRSKPYKLQELGFEDFYDIKKLQKDTICNRSIDTDGKKIKWGQIKWLKFKKESPGIIFFKTDLKEENFRVLNVSRKGRRRMVVQPGILERAFQETLPISDAKKGDLISLCNSGAIPRAYHVFYNQLPCSMNIIDRLPDPDINESDHESEIEF